MAEFDAFRDNYREELEGAIAFSGVELDHFTEVKARRLVDLGERLIGPARRLSVLDVGCGTGDTDRFLAPAVGTLKGADVSEGLLARARAANPGVEYRVYNGQRLPWDERVFDLVFCINVLHHVSPPDWGSFVADMARVTRPGGVVAVFEHNPLNPVTRYVVSHCSFDDDAVLMRRGQLRKVLAGQGLTPARSDYILFVPARKSWVDPIERRLGWLPLGAQYYVAARV